MNEILYPLYEEKRCTEIINDYELEEEKKKNGKESKKYQALNVNIIFHHLRNSLKCWINLIIKPKLVCF